MQISQALGGAGGALINQRLLGITEDNLVLMPTLELLRTESANYTAGSADAGAATRNGWSWGSTS